MFNPYSSSFYGCGYKVKKALKFTVTSVSALKALCPMKDLARIFSCFQENESKKEKRISQFRHSSFISPWAWVLSDATSWDYTSNGFGSSRFETTDKPCTILAGVNSWHVLLPVQMLNVICLPPG